MIKSRIEYNNPFYSLIVRAVTRTQNEKFTLQLIALVL